jgi:hypothetical protein
MAAGLGFKDFATGEVLTSQDVDGYLMQGVWVFASAAARDAAVTAPQEGNFAYLKDTNVTTYYTGSAWANLDTTGMTNPMTTTGDTIYSSSGSTPARLGIGSTGQVLTVAGGVPSWATPAAGGGGKVLQVINATYATGTSNSTSTYADTGLTATITPSSATSKVLVLVNQAGCSRGNQDDANSVMIRLLRGATEIVSDFVGKAGANMGNNYVWMGGVGNTNFLDSPATTSATTYKTQFRNGRNGDLVTVQTDSGRSTITLLEIGA